MPTMYNKAMRLVRTKQDPEDVIQEVFIKVFRDLNSLKFPLALGMWIKRITINTGVSHLRKQKLIHLIGKMNLLTHLKRRTLNLM